MGAYRRYVKLILGAVICIALLDSVIHFRFTWDHEEQAVHRARPIGRHLLVKRNLIQDRKCIEDWTCFGCPQNSGSSTCSRIRVSAPMGNPGIGNQMFQYAALLGIAYRLNATPVLPKDSPLRQMFNISARFSDVIDTYTVTKWQKWKEAKSLTYDGRVDDLPRDTNVKLEGFFQSWKYFKPIESIIRKEFSFREGLLSEARRYIAGHIRHVYGNHTYRDDVITVGVHVRRGDMVFLAGVGYSVAPRRYFAKAISNFQSAFPKQKLLFILCTNPLPETEKWLDENIKGISKSSPLIRTNHSDPALDMAILSQCDHVIQSVGSFGWWSAWLAGGNSTYFRRFPRQKSLLSRLFNKEDYFLPNWTDIG